MIADNQHNNIYKKVQNCQQLILILLRFAALIIVRVVILVVEGMYADDAVLGWGSGKGGG